MMKYILSAFLALIFFLPARAQMAFSDSVRICLLTCSPGAETYARFGHSALRLQDLRNTELDLVFHYGVFSFNTPHFIYRFVKGETDYQLGAEYTEGFLRRYARDGMGIVEQQLSIDSAQTQELIRRLIINYEPENRTYRYSFFFDNCATRPYHLLNASTDNVIEYDSTWTNAITLREMVQNKTGRDNWLDFGIALAVAGRADRATVYEEQMFLPDYLMGALSHARIPSQLGESVWMTPLVAQESTLLELQPEVAAAIAAPDSVSPNTVFAIVLLIALLLSGLEFASRRRNLTQVTPTGAVLVGKGRGFSMLVNCFDTILLLVVGLTGCIVWFLNFLSEHPAVDHNINCFWLLPTHVIMAVLLWFRRLDKACQIYFGITFAALIIYVILDWISGQYCPIAFLLLIATLLLRSFMHFGLGNSK